MQRRHRLWIACAAPFLGLLLAEIAVRVADVGPVPGPEREGLLFRVSADRELTWENRPGARRTIRYRDAVGGEPRVVELRVNQQGFRGPEVTDAPEPGVLRIACIGDSHTFGSGVGDDETWPAALERSLLAEDPARRVEVLNCGVPAYDTRREVLLLRDRVLELEPQLVLLQYHVNDVRPRSRLGLKAPESDALLELTAPDRGGWLGALRSVSHLADTVCDRLYRARLVRQESGLSMAPYADDSPGWQRVREALVDARDLLARHDVDFAVVLYPYLLRDGEHLSSHDAFARVAEFCAEQGIAYYDAEPVFRGLDPEVLRVHAHDFHANAEANRLFAEGVHTWLRAQGLVEPARFDW